jgi:hypothetical protein
MKNSYINFRCTKIVYNFIGIIFSTNCWGDVKLQKCHPFEVLKFEVFFLQFICNDN